MLISLSYLPTAERLTVVVMKAKDLRVPITTPSSGIPTFENNLSQFTRQQIYVVVLLLFFAKMCNKFNLQSIVLLIHGIIRLFRKSLSLQLKTAKNSK